MDGADGRIGRYRLTSVLGRGAFGTVYLAEDADLDRCAAIKVLHSDRLASERARDAFRREAKLAAALTL